ncbi:MAG: hypothetical protein HY700_04110 [Gemmatimonadetes bacterium]|nr:hypothetical protein [Gemmatimonadota bacterium]
MIRMRVGMSLLGLSLVAAAPALAQMQAMPVYFSPKGGTGITIDGDFGRAASTKIAGLSAANHPTAIGGRAYLGLPFVTVGLGASIYDPKIVNVNNSTQFMGSAALKVFGGPLVPLAVSLQAGAGYLKAGSGTGASKTVSVPIGLGFALNVPTPGASLEPWVAGRLNLRSVSVGTSSASRIGPGISGGLSMGLPIGLGLHVGVDWSSFAAKTGATVISERSKLEQLTVGVGVHYMIKLPGLPGVPIVPGV